MKAEFPAEMSAGGEFQRQPDMIREWVTPDGASPFPVVSGRYILIVSWACPWAHRTIIARRLKGLEPVVRLIAVDPIRDERGWAFCTTDGSAVDPGTGFRFLAEAYRATDPGYRGRVTVPVLWDTVMRRIVSNSDDDLMRMFNDKFSPFGNPGVDLYPVDLRRDIDHMNAFIYEAINDGVYRAGFATSQTVYEREVLKLFEALDVLEQRLADRRFIFGDCPVETDWRLFVTLVRFDVVYYGHFKCNLRRISDYPNLFGYLCDLFQQDGISDTVNFDHIKRHYYLTHTTINPTAIVPLGPSVDLMQPHGRGRLHRNEESLRD